MAYTWTAGVDSGFEFWRALAYGDGTLIAIVGEGSNILNTSTDNGQTFSPGTLPVTDYWIDIAYNGEVFCAICTNDSSVAATSDDNGTSWTTRTLPAAANWKKIVAGTAGKFCAIATGGTSTAVSTDNGATWTLGTLPDARNWTGLAWNGRVWVASSGQDLYLADSIQFAISEDGLDWEFVTVPSGYWETIACNDSVFCSVKFSNECITSVDGRTWEVQTIPSGDWNCLTATTDGLFVAAAGGTTDAVESGDNGATWTASTLPSASAWRAICHTGLRVVLISSGDEATAFSNASAITTHLTNPGESVETTVALIGTGQINGVVAETVDTTTAVVADVYTLIHEAITLDAALTSTALMSVSVVEALGLDTRLVAVLEAMVNDSLLAFTVESGSTVVSIALMDALVLSGVAVEQVTAMALLSEALALNSAVALIYDGVISDNLELTDYLTTRVVAMESIVASVVLTDTAQSAAIISVIVDEGLVFDDSTALQTIQNAVINESIEFSISFTLLGEPYYGICLNAKTKAVTEFTNYNFNSLATKWGRMFGATEAGLVEMAGDDDDGTPIDARLKTFFSRIADGKNTRAEAAYLGYKSTGTMQLKVIVSENGVKKAYIYDLVTQTASTFRPGRIKLGRGMKSVYYAFELSNADGADFDLDVMEIRPLVLSRRIP